MKSVVNRKLANRNRRLAGWMFLLTLAALIGGFIFVNMSLFTQEVPSSILLLLQILVLPLVFILTIISVRLTNNWARRPYPEDAIEGGAKGLSNKSIIYHYYHNPARHVLITPQGVFAIVTRWHDGRFSVEKDRWRTHRSGIARFFSFLRMDGIANPTREAERAATHVRKLLKSIAPDVEVQPLIIFVDPRAEVDVKESDIPILYADEKQKPNLTSYLREVNREQKEAGQQHSSLPLTQDQIEAFEAATIK